MPELSKDFIALLQYLLPGFLVAWICYGLTSHQKPVQFERVIQALIYALFVHFIVVVIRWACLKLGEQWSGGTWSSESELFVSLLVALAVGVGFSFLINSDWIHRLFRNCGLSTRSSHPSEWCTAFDAEKKYIVAHLKDERRLYGWPHIWPSDPTKGHLFLSHAHWIDDADGSVEGPALEIMIDVADIKWIEFISERTV